MNLRPPFWVYGQTAVVKRISTNGRGEKIEKVILQNVSCRLERKTAEVKKPDGSTTVSRAWAMFPIGGTPISAGDVVECDGVKYTVIDFSLIPSKVGYSHQEGNLE